MVKCETLSKPSTIEFVRIANTIYTALNLQDLLVNIRPCGESICVGAFAMLSIHCPAQNYAWGKQGSSSLVAQLQSASRSTDIDENKTFAELWMGTHPSGSAKVSDSLTLLDILNRHNQVVGIVPNGYSENDLPFLFKVLSIQTALSIQAHPDKERAISLNSRFPDIYKDPNHKPEMVIALGDFECLSGFRTKEEIVKIMNEYPEFAELVMGNGFSEEDLLLEEEAFIRKLFLVYMSSSASAVSNCLQKMVRRLHEIPSTAASDLPNLLLRLFNQYPDDIGVFAPLMLNYLQLKSGDSFFIGPNIPHAYISGDCVECMALSDNVVRAGLTPKLRDVETLCEMLTYEIGKPAFIQTVAIDNDVHDNDTAKTILYRPPKSHCAEFEVEQISFACISRGSTATIALRSLPAASLVLVMVAPRDGFAAHVTTTLLPNDDDLFQRDLVLKQGSVFFLSANTATQLSANAEGNYVLYRAHVNLAE